MFQLVDGWENAWKMFSMWFFLVLGLMPELFNMAVASGLVEAEAAPKILSYSISVVAFLGAAARLIKQKAVEAGLPGVK